jgi:hypothetical protein
MRLARVLLAFTSAVTILLYNNSSQATDYKFHVSCQQRSFNVIWKTGTIDPGKEYLRVVTGTRNAGCSIGDFNEATDGGLPTDEYSGAGGVLQGTPPVAIICGIFHC